jgi:hypothetical protein
MKHRGWFVYMLFAIPTVALVIAIIMHKPLEKTEIVTRPQLLQTQSAWTNQPFVHIETNADFIAKIQNIKVKKNNVQLSSRELASLRQASVNLVFANFLCNYSDFRDFRTPIPQYEPPSDQVRSGWERWYRSIFTNTPVPSSIDDTISNVWVSVYGRHPYWTVLGLTKSEITLMATNKLFGGFSMQIFDDKAKVYCLQSITAGTYSYNTVMRDILSKRGELKIAKLFLWAGSADQFNKPRPFLYVMVLDTDSNIWFPIEAAQCSTTGSEYAIPF